MLEQRILDKGMELEGLKYYIESFKHGVSPHAGAGIGLERVVFLYLGEYLTQSRTLLIAIKRDYYEVRRSLSRQKEVNKRRLIMREVLL